MMRNVGQRAQHTTDWAILARDTGKSLQSSNRDSSHKMTSYNTQITQMTQCHCTPAQNTKAQWHSTADQSEQQWQQTGPDQHLTYQNREDRVGATGVFIHLGGAGVTGGWPRLQQWHHFIQRRHFLLTSPHNHCNTQGICNVFCYCYCNFYHNYQCCRLCRSYCCYCYCCCCSL